MTTITHLTKVFATIARQLQRITVKVQSGTTGIGSGVIWQADDIKESTLIVTNAHVAMQRQATIELWDGRRFEAIRTKIYPEPDLAILEINATGLATATIANSDNLRVGELVIAVGNPLDDIGAVTTGIIHSRATNAVIADIRLFPGNSGGVLADCQGRVIGINTMIAYGLAIAIPASTVNKLLSPENRTEAV